MVSCWGFFVVAGYVTQRAYEPMEGCPQQPYDLLLRMSLMRLDGMSDGAGQMIGQTAREGGNSMLWIADEVVCVCVRACV